MFRTSLILLGVAISLIGPNVSANTLNLLGRGSNLSSPLTINAGGINVTLSAGILNSSATTFGIDSNTSGGYIDDPNLIDGNETLFMLFNQDVLLDAITISHFDDQDIGTLVLKSVTNFPLHNGVINVGGIRLTANSTDYRVQSDIGPVAGGTRGFSLDAIDFRPVPEPTACALAFLAICGHTMWLSRRRHRRK